MPPPKAGGGRGSLVEWLRSRGRHVVAAGCATGTAWLCGLGGGGGLPCAAEGGIMALMSPISEADYRERMRLPVSRSPMGALGPAAMACGILGSASLLWLLPPPCHVLCPQAIPWFAPFQ